MVVCGCPRRSEVQGKTSRAELVQVAPTVFFTLTRQRYVKQPDAAVLKSFGSYQARRRVAECDPRELVSFAVRSPAHEDTTGTTD